MMKNAIKYLNKMEPGKKQQIILPYWFEIYSSNNLPNLYSNQQQFDDDCNRLGRDIAFLLVAVKENGVSELEESREIRGLDLLFTGLMDAQDDLYTWKKPNCLSCPFYSEEKGGELYARIR
jgi:hypothetical protein